jgi:DNA repair exonuclease SbcCD ATPase subunit
VAHVTVDQHLAVLDRMEEAERRSSELVQEREEMRRLCREAKSEAAQSRSERDSIARDIEAVILERDRHLSQSSQARLELAQVADENKRLRQELANAGLKRQALESQLQTEQQEKQEAAGRSEQAERKYQKVKRQVQSLRGLACPECRLREREMDAVDDFFEETPQIRAGRSCYGRPLPQLPPDQRQWQGR